MAFRSGRRTRKGDAEPEVTSAVEDEQAAAVQDAAAARVDAESELAGVVEDGAPPDTGGAVPDEEEAAEEIAHLIGSTTVADVDDPLGQNKPTEEEMEALLADQLGPHTEEEPEPGEDIDQGSAAEVIGSATETSEEGGPAIDMTADPSTLFESPVAAERARFGERLDDLFTTPDEVVDDGPAHDQSIIAAEGKKKGTLDNLIDASHNANDPLATTTPKGDALNQAMREIDSLGPAPPPDAGPAPAPAPTPTPAAPAPPVDDNIKSVKNNSDAVQVVEMKDGTKIVYAWHNGTKTTVAPDGTTTTEPLPSTPPPASDPGNYEEYVDPELQRLLDSAIQAEDTSVVDYYNRQRGRDGAIDPAEGDGTPTFGAGSPAGPVPDAQEELLIGPGGDPNVPDTGGGGIHTDPTAGGDVDPLPEEAGTPQTSGPSERDTTHDVTDETEHPAPADASEEEADVASFLPPPVTGPVDTGPDLPDDITPPD